MTTQRREGRSHVRALLLAAGSSRRFGAANKLLQSIGGRTVVAKTCAALAASRVGEIVVVTGSDADAVRAALSGFPVRFAHNDAHAEGIGASIAAGARALGGGTGGVLVVQGDMPGLGAALVDRMIAAFEQARGEAIIVPVLADGTRVSPVLWPDHYVAELAALSGDRGAKSLIAREEGHVRPLPLADDEAALLIDVDTPEALEVVRRRLERTP